VAEWLEQLAAVHVGWPNPEALAPTDAPPPRSIPADRLRWIVAMIGWNETELAARMGRRAHKVVQLLAGDAELKQAEQQWLDALVAAHVASPLPMGWTRREDAPFVRCSGADGDDS
jgi:hypothetical protein